MLPQTGGTVLCAVSGGRDSVCLLHYLCSVSDACGFSVAAALHVPFYTDGADVVAVAAEMGRGVEETGRLLRYAYLEEVADQIGAERIATAHHMGGVWDIRVLYHPSLLHSIGSKSVCLPNV